MDLGISSSVNGSEERIFVLVGCSNGYEDG